MIFNTWVYGVFLAVFSLLYWTVVPPKAAPRPAGGGMIFYTYYLARAYPPDSGADPGDIRLRLCHHRLMPLPRRQKAILTQNTFILSFGALPGGPGLL